MNHRPRMPHTMRCSLMLFICLPALASAAAWQPPIGIPPPEFGIKEQAPALPRSWNGDVAGFYYVQRDGTNPGNGHPGRPRAAIPANLPAGAVVILAGRYDVKHESGITAHGTSARPVFIRGMPGPRRPVITQKWEVRGSYYIIENINAEWANASGNGKLNVGGHHGVVRHMDLRGDTGTGVGEIGVGGNHMVIYKNVVHDCGDYKKAVDDDTGGIYIGTGSHFWVVDNTCYRNGRGCVNINPGYYNDGSVGNQKIQYVYVGRNTAWQNRETNFWSKHANHVIFSQNTSYQPVDNRPGNTPSGMGFQYGPENVWFLFNHIHDAADGIVIQGNSVTHPGKNTYLVGNLIHNISGDGIRLRGGRTIHIANNTIHGVKVGIRAQEAGGENTYLLWNNIVAGASEELLLTNRPEQWTVRHLLADKKLFDIDCSKCRFDNPSFVKPEGGDFRIGPESPAIDAGTEVPVYEKFRELYGIDIARDIAGQPRPANAGYDIGAYEAQ